MKGMGRIAAHFLLVAVFCSSVLIAPAGQEETVNWGVADHDAFTNMLRQCEAVRSLRLVEFGLDELPPEIGRLTNLVHLAVVPRRLFGSARLRRVPAEIGRLANLESLVLQLTQITSLPPEVGDLHRLKVLGIFHSPGLTNLPDAVCRLTELRHLEVVYHALAALPDELGALTNLTTLDVRSGYLAGLPPSTTNLTSLTEVRLGGNRLGTVPSEIWSLTNLCSLSLPNSGLRDLPRDIRSLTRLEYLDLGNNQLTFLPDAVRQLRSLKSLRLQKNHFSNDEKERIRRLLPEVDVAFDP